MSVGSVGVCVGRFGGRGGRGLHWEVGGGLIARLIAAYDLQEHFHIQAIVINNNKSSSGTLMEMQVKLAALGDYHGKTPKPFLNGNLVKD